MCGRIGNRCIWRVREDDILQPEDQFLRQRLQKEIPILRALIQNLYEELDRKLHLNGAKVPITFGYDTDTLGSYTRRSAHEKEHFHFSLLFIAYGVKNPLSKEDRIDLFKHEYAHYMQYNMRIPEKYKMAGWNTWKCVEILLFSYRCSTDTLL